MSPLNLALAYDTETTGLPLWSEPSEDPRQPHIVQLAAVLFDPDTSQVLEELDVIIRPEGYTIPEEVTAIHGISTERALAEGIPAPEALERFLALAAGRLRVAHNESFDARIVRIALMRHRSAELAEEWKGRNAACTQRMATPLLNLPATPKMRAKGMRGPKSANLAEAYRHFTGRELEGAHSALADARACMAVYLAIRKARAAVLGAPC